jgi:hypothetical protein
VIKWQTPESVKSQHNTHPQCRWHLPSYFKIDYSIGDSLIMVCFTVPLTASSHCFNLLTDENSEQTDYMCLFQHNWFYKTNKPLILSVLISRSFLIQHLRVTYNSKQIQHLRALFNLQGQCIACFYKYNYIVAYSCKKIKQIAKHYF